MPSHSRFVCDVHQRSGHGSHLAPRFRSPTQNTGNQPHDLRDVNHTASAKPIASIPGTRQLSFEVQHGMISVGGCTHPVVSTDVLTQLAPPSRKATPSVSLGCSKNEPQASTQRNPRIRPTRLRDRAHDFPTPPHPHRGRNPGHLPNETRRKVDNNREIPHPNGPGNASSENTWRLAYELRSCTPMCPSMC